MNTVTSRAFEKYRRMSATGYLDGTIEVKINGKIISDKLNYHTEPIAELSFSDFDDIPTLISGCYGGYLIVWKIINGKWKNVFVKDYKTPIISLATGKSQFAVALKDKRIEAFSYENHTLIKSYANLKCQPLRITFINNSDNLVAATDNGKIIYLEASGLDTQVNNLIIIAIAANISSICVIGNDGTTKIITDSTTDEIPRDNKTKPIGCFWDDITNNLLIVLPKSLESWARLPNGNWVLE